MAIFKATIGSLFYGSVDFADLREYQPEDDIRYIDWNVSARMNTPYDLSKSSTTHLAPLFKSGLNAIKKRSLVFVISDFISAPGWEKSLNLLS